MIVPTVGRQVWYHDLPPGPRDQPMAATIVYVHSERLVNLAILNHGGHLVQRQSVQLLQDEEPHPAGPFCQWMPYQKGVAKGEILPVLHAQEALAKKT